MLVTSMGMVFRISKRNMKRYLVACIDAGETCDLEEYGARFLGHVQMNLTDTEDADWRDWLDDLNQKKD